MYIMEKRCSSSPVSQLSIGIRWELINIICVVALHQWRKAGFVLCVPENSRFLIRRFLVVFFSVVLIFCGKKNEYHRSMTSIVNNVNYRIQNRNNISLYSYPKTYIYIYKVKIQLPGLSPDVSVEDSGMHIAFFDSVGTIPWTRSIRESKENCFPDIRIPRILLLIACGKNKTNQERF